ncbi:MAG: hypothetical protein IPN71_21580 [Fibrobacteres bacterium]|nr:hypothetical protein [Fibrobacterota bacterium]
MRKFIALSALLVGLVACDDKSSGGSTTAPTANPGSTNTAGTLQGAYKSAEMVKGEYQTMTFGPDSQVIYKREMGACVTEQDTGTARLVTEEGMVGLEINLVKGVGVNFAYTGTGCAPLSKLTQDEIAFFGEPSLFRWVVPGTSFELLVGPSQWFRFNKI